MFYLTILGEYDAALVQVLRTGNTESDKKNIESYIALGYTEVTKEQFNNIENAIKLPEPFNIEALKFISIEKTSKK